MAIMFPIVQKLGGWAEANKALTRRGVVFSEISRKRAGAPSRGRLPRDVVAALASEASGRGIVFCVSDFERAEDDAT